MNSELQRELRSYLHKYLRGQIDLDEFDDWFSPLALSIRELGSPELRQEVADIEHWLGELSIGYWNEDEFRQLIQHAGTVAGQGKKCRTFGPGPGWGKGCGG